MKKLIPILAIAFVSLNFVSCRQDDVTADLENKAAPQEKTNFNRVSDSIASSIVKPNSVANKDGEPEKDPPKDRTHW